MAILKNLLHLCRQHWPALKPAFALRLIMTLGAIAIEHELPALPSLQEFTAHPDLITLGFSYGLNPWLWAWLAWELAVLTLYSYVEPAVFYGVWHRQTTGQTCTPAAALAFSREHWVRYTTTGFFVVAAVAGGCCLFLVPGLLLLSRLFLFGPILLFEGRSGPEACRSSAKRMDKTSRWAVLKLLGCCYLAAYVASAAFVALADYAGAGSGSGELLRAGGEVTGDLIWLLWSLLPLSIYLAQIPSCSPIRTTPAANF